MSLDKIVILGGGFGGLTVAEELAKYKGPYEVTLISKIPYFTYIPSLHELVSQKICKEDITFSLHDFLTPRNTQFVCDTIEKIDVQRGMIYGKQEILFDYLVLALGSISHFYNLPIQNSSVYELKTLEDALHVKNTLSTLLQGNTPAHVTIIGAGATGVELAGEIVDCNNDLLRITLLEAKERILPMYNEDVARFVAEYLIAKGITITTGAHITTIENNTIQTKTEQLKTDIIIWTAGIAASPLIHALGLPMHMGSLVVTQYLHSPAAQHIFGAGDNIYYEDKFSKRVAVATALYAISEGKTVAKNMYNLLTGRPLYPFRVSPKPSLLSLGNRMGVLSYKDFFMKGFTMGKLKKLVERHYLWAHA